MSGDAQAFPGFAVLVDWLEGRLDPASTASVARRVECGDRRTVSAVAWLRAVMDAGKSMPLEQPPPSVRAELRLQFVRWRNRRGSAAPEFVADLFFDSREHRMLAGSQGGPDGSIHLAYGSPPIDILIDVRPVASGSVRLDGQLLSSDADSSDGVCVATAVGSGATLDTSDIDALGRFTLSIVPDTISELRVSHRDFEVIAALDVRSRGRG